MHSAIVRSTTEPYRRGIVEWAKNNLALSQVSWKDNKTFQSKVNTDNLKKGSVPDDYLQHISRFLLSLNKTDFQEVNQLKELLLENYLNPNRRSLWYLVVLERIVSAKEWKTLCQSLPDELPANTTISALTSFKLDVWVKFRFMKDTGVDRFIGELSWYFVKLDLDSKRKVLRVIDANFSKLNHYSQSIVLNWIYNESDIRLEDLDRSDEHFVEVNRLYWQAGFSILEQFLRSLDNIDQWYDHLLPIFKVIDITDLDATPEVGPFLE